MRVARTEGRGKTEDPGRSRGGKMAEKREKGAAPMDYAEDMVLK